ncbi:MAG: DNA mismatch repair endonuclease MutL, partial [Halobacteriota archaeon]
MSDRSIRRLPAEVVDRIAAGEVVTRPARVVSELLENALDAEATRVDVTVEGDGTDRIVVADDGCGIARSDAPTALQRHTTSKLDPTVESLDRIDSLGFRGEALASIADCATLRLTTNDGGRRGIDVTVDRRSSEPTVREAGRARGTTVEVTDLFGGRPARKESLAAPETEFRRITEVVTAYAIVRPDVRFTLTHDGSETLSTTGRGFTDALWGLYDRDVAGA